MSDDIYTAGSHWISKDGKRQVRIENEAARFRGERCFIMVNEATGRGSNLSLSGLRAKFFHLSTFAPDYYGIWEKKASPFKGSRVEITGYVTRVGDTIALSGHIVDSAVITGQSVKTGVFFSAPSNRLLAEWRRVESA